MAVIGINPHTDPQNAIAINVCKFEIIKEILILLIQSLYCRYLTQDEAVGMIKKLDFKKKTKGKR
jgi:hypothetical protein